MCSGTAWLVLEYELWGMQDEESSWGCICAKYGPVSFPSSMHGQVLCSTGNHLRVKCSCCWHQTPLSGMKYVSVFQVMVGTKEATHPSCKIWASTTCKVFGIPVLPNMQLKPLWCSSEALTDCYCNVQSLANFIVLCTCIYCCVVQNRIGFLMSLPNQEKRKWLLWFTLPACNFSLDFLISSGVCVGDTRDIVHIRNHTFLFSSQDFKFEYSISVKEILT